MQGKGRKNTADKKSEEIEKKEKKVDGELRKVVEAPKVEKSSPRRAQVPETQVIMHTVKTL